MEKNTIKHFKQIIHLAVGRCNMICLIVLAVLCTAKDLAGVITLAYATDQVMAQTNVMQALLLMAVTMLVGVAIAGANRYVLGQISAQVRRNLLQQYEQKMLRIQLQELEKMDSGKLLTEFTGDIEKLGRWVTFTLPKMLELAAYLVGAICYSLTQNIVLTLTVMPAVAIITPILLKIVRHLSVIIQTERAVSDKTVSKISSLFYGLEFVKTYTLEDQMEQTVDALLDQKKKQDYSASLHRGLSKAISYFISYLPGLLSGAAGGYFLLKGYITTGFLIGFIQMMMGRISYAFPQIGSFLSDTREAAVYAARVTDFLNAPEELPLDNTVSAQPHGAFPDEPVIVFDSVSFGYDGREELLHEISFRIERGQKVAFVGPSGCGKSTILKLIMGYYPDRYRGSIRIMGEELSEVNPSSLRDQIAPVFQENPLFSGTVQENLQMSGSSDNLAQVASQMGFDEAFLTSETGERGIMLSGGQRQRVAIARGLLKDAPIYLLDEPLASLDNVTEQALLKEFSIVLKGRTTVMVEHRYEAVLDADYIFFLEHGRIIERGTHASLLKLGGAYAAMYQRQARKGV